MPENPRVLYLHGFASSPASRKARFLTEQLAALGVVLLVPDLAGGSFEKLTISGQLEVVENAVEGRPCVLIGSSLGGYLAALYAARFAHVQRLVLLAPAFGFPELWVAQLGPERLARWRETGSLDVFHYSALRNLPLGYRFLEDALQYEPFPDARQPTLIFHGTQDAVVPLAQSVAFVQAHPYARLVELASDHELTDVLPVIWEESFRFLRAGDSR